MVLLDSVGFFRDPGGIDNRSAKTLTDPIIPSRIKQEPVCRNIIIQAVKEGNKLPMTKYYAFFLEHPLIEAIADIHVLCNKPGPN